MIKKIKTIIKIGLLAGPPSLIISSQPGYSQREFFINEELNLSPNNEALKLENNLFSPLSKKIVDVDSVPLIESSTHSEEKSSIKHMNNFNKSLFNKETTLNNLEWKNQEKGETTKIRNISHIDQIGVNEFLGYGTLEIFSDGLDGSISEIPLKNINDLFILKINDSGIESISQLDFSKALNNATLNGFNGNTYFKFKENHSISKLDIRQIVSSKEKSETYIKLNLFYENDFDSSDIALYESIIKLDTSSSSTNVLQDFKIRFTYGVSDSPISITKNYIFIGNPIRQPNRKTSINYIPIDDFKSDSSYGFKKLILTSESSYIIGMSKTDNNGSNSPIIFNFFFKGISGDYKYYSSILPYDVEGIETKNQDFFTKDITGIMGRSFNGNHISSKNASFANVKIGILKNKNAFFKLYNRERKATIIWTSKISQNSSESISDFLTRVLENSSLWDWSIDFSGNKKLKFIIDFNGEMNILAEKEEWIDIKNLKSKNITNFLIYDKNKFDLDKFGVHIFNQKYLFFNFSEQGGQYVLVDKDKTNYTNWLSFVGSDSYYVDSNFSNIPFHFYKSLYYSGNALINIIDIAVSKNSIIVLYENNKIKIFDINKSYNSYFISENSQKTLSHSSSLFNSIEFVKEKNLFILNKKLDEFESFSLNTLILNSDATENNNLMNSINPSTSKSLSGSKWGSYDLIEFKVDKYNPKILGYSKIRNKFLNSTNYIPIFLNHRESIMDIGVAEHKNLEDLHWIIHPNSGLILYDGLNARNVKSYRYKVSQNTNGKYEFIRTESNNSSINLSSNNDIIASELVSPIAKHMEIQKSIYGNSILIKDKREDISNNIRLYPFNFEKGIYDIRISNLDLLKALDGEYLDHDTTTKSSENIFIPNQDIKMVNDKVILFKVDNKSSDDSALIYYNFIDKIIIKAYSYDKSKLSFETFNKNSNINIVKDMHANILIPYFDKVEKANKYLVFDSKTFKEYKASSDFNHVIKKKTHTNVKLKKINIKNYDLELVGKIGETFLSVGQEDLLEKDGVELIIKRDGHFQKVDLERQSPLQLKLNEELSVYAEFKSNLFSNIDNWIKTDSGYLYKLLRPFKIKADHLPIPEINTKSINFSELRLSNNDFTSRIEDTDLLKRLNSDLTIPLNRFATISKDVLDPKSTNFLIKGLKQFWINNSKFIDNKNIDFLDIFKFKYKVYRSNDISSLNIINYDSDFPPKNLQIGDKLDISIHPKYKQYKFQPITKSFLIKSDDITDWDDILAKNIEITDSSNDEKNRYLKINSLQNHLNESHFWSVTIDRNPTSKLKNVENMEYIENRIVLEIGDTVTIKLMIKDSKTFEKYSFKTTSDNKIIIKKKIENISPLRGSRDIVEVNVDEIIDLPDYERELFSLVKGSPRDPLYSIHLNDGLKNFLDKGHVSKILDSNDYMDPYIMYKLGEEKWSRTSPGKLENLKSLSVKIVLEEKIKDPSQSYKIIHTNMFNPKPSLRSELNYSESSNSIKNGEYMIWVFSSLTVTITFLIVGSIIFVKKKKKAKIKKIAK